MQFNELDHLAIAVADTEQALKTWRDKLGLKVLYAEVVNGGAVLLTHLDLGNTRLQLVQPLRGDSPLALAIRDKGSHLHHLCLGVDNVELSRQELLYSGIATAPAMHQGTGGKRALFVSKEETDTIQVELTGE